MESLQTVKRRLKSVHNIGQITKAMELVAATKMRKSQEIALNSRPYSFAALELLARISNQKMSLPPLLVKREVKKSAFVLITSDKGLAGSFNSQVIKNFERYARNNKIDAKDQKSSFIAVGGKANVYLQNRGIKVVKKFTRVGDYTSSEQTDPIADFLAEGFLKKDWDQVIDFSTYFKSALKQEVLARKIFPVELEAIAEAVKEIVPKTGKFAQLLKENNISFIPEKADDYLIEPSASTVLKRLARHLVRMNFYHLILETNASEHAARRVAMKNAFDNSQELSEKLTILYNKSRQAAITKEITEVVSSAESLKK